MLRHQSTLMLLWTLRALRVQYTTLLGSTSMTLATPTTTMEDGLADDVMTDLHSEWPDILLHGGPLGLLPTAELSGGPLGLLPSAELSGGPLGLLPTCRFLAERPLTG